jgi:hypothetical protein
MKTQRRWPLKSLYFAQALQILFPVHALATKQLFFFASGLDLCF